MQRLVGRCVEEQGAGGLDRRCPECCLSGGSGQVPSVSAHKFAAALAPRFRSFARASVAPGIRFPFSLDGVCALPAAQRGRAWSVRAALSRSPRCTCSSGSRTWSAPNRSNPGASSRWTPRTARAGLRTCSSYEAPAGRSTRLTSATAAPASGIGHNDSVHTTVSKVASELERLRAPSRKATNRPSSTARPRGMSSIAGTNSIPVSRTHRRSEEG